jgi:phage terminase large subunit-like protein
MEDKRFFDQRLELEMKIRAKNPPRVFNVGKNSEIKISDCGEVELNPDEQVTFLTSSGKHYDVVAKSWGFYATSSVNARLKKEGFKAALVKNTQGRYYVMIVEKEKIGNFEAYLRMEQNKVEKWLDEL